MYLVYNRFNEPPNLQYEEAATLFEKREEAENCLAENIANYTKYYSDDKFKALAEENSCEFESYCVNHGLDYDMLDDVAAIKEILLRINHLRSPEGEDYFELRLLENISWGKTFWLSE